MGRPTGRERPAERFPRQAAIEVARWIAEEIRLRRVERHGFARYRGTAYNDAGRERPSGRTGVVPRKMNSFVLRDEGVFIFKRRKA